MSNGKNIFKVRCTNIQLSTIHDCGVLFFYSRSKDLWLLARKGDEICASNWSCTTATTFEVLERGFAEIYLPGDRSPSMSLALRVRLERPVNTRSIKFVSKLTEGKYTAHVSQTNYQDREVARLMERHKFGRASSIVNLIVKCGRPWVGICLLDTYNPKTKNANASNYFDEYDKICDHMFIIRRIVNIKPDLVSSRSVQNICFALCERVCAFLDKNDDVSLVANSYDFIISAYQYGFNCAIPENSSGQIFYWKMIQRKSSYRLSYEEATRRYRAYLGRRPTRIFRRRLMRNRHTA